MEQDKYIIEQATSFEVDAITVCYNELIDYLERTTNYPGWKKDVYPTQETAAQGVKEGSLYVLKIDNCIAGSIIVNKEIPEAYHQISNWNVEASDENLLVIHTFAVHPNYMKLGVGEKLLSFAEELARKSSIKSIRLDVSEHNTPAIHLYEKMNYQYIETIDLGIGIPYLKWFKVYELRI